MSRFLRCVIAMTCLLVVAGTPAASGAVATERVIVRLKATAGDTRLIARTLMSDNGGTLGPVYTRVMKGFAARLPADRLSALRNNPNVDVVIPDGATTGANVEVPPGVARIGAASMPGTLIGTRGAVDADIAILDTGINAHPDLNLAGGVNCAQDTGCSATSYADGHGHGTHVAGTAAAKDDGVGVVGTAPGARVWGVKVLGDTNGGRMSWFIAGLDWVVARGGIEVVNGSLGGAIYAPVNDAIARATAAGVVVVVSAGNDAIDAANVSPASAPNAITVSAYQDNDGAPGALGGSGDDVWASFSNYGAVVDVAAPGVSIKSTASTGGYVWMSGTSMASPHVAGAAAAYITTHNVASSPTRWQTILDAFRTAWGASRVSACGFSGGPSGEPVVVMGGCSGDADAPTPVTLTGTSGAGQASLQWSASSDGSGISGYRIYRSIGTAGCFTALTTLDGATTTYADTALTMKQLYRYYVIALDAATTPNQSSPSNIVGATPPSGGTPPWLTAQGCDKKVTLQWAKLTNPVGIKGYQLWRSTSESAPVLRGRTGATTAVFTDTTVVNNTSYYYSLRYIDSAGVASGDYASAVVSPVDNVAPGVPTPSITVGDGKLTLKWAASRDSTGVRAYAIYRAVGTGPFEAAILVSPNTLTYVDTGLTNYTSYRYYMTATDLKNQTSAKSAIRTTMPKDLTGPAAVSVSATASDSRADISWTQATDVSGIASYKVYRAVGTATTYSLIATLPSSARTFAHTGLNAGTSYRYLVRAVDTKNNLGAMPTPAAVTTPTTGMRAVEITAKLGTPGATTTPTTFVIQVRSTTTSAVAVSGAKVSFQIRNGAGVAGASGTVATTTAGAATIRASLPRGSTYSVTITGLTAVGRTWDGITPANSVSVA